jgi:glycosyltransferase involved in cell wall biosynthesis
MTLSVIIIAKNAGTMIRRCIESLAWADEIVVVDSGSTDDTQDICRELGAKVIITTDWPGFGAQKNRALDAARGDWVFSIDTDEWVTPELRDEIRATINGAAAAPAYVIPRSSSFCGRYMKHSGWWPDYVIRLFQRGSARFSDDLVHERLIVDGAIHKLRQPLMHETVTDLHQLVNKMNMYSSASARDLHTRGRRASIWTALLHGGWAFFRTYVLRAGFLDGREGLMLAIANAEGSYYRYVKLMLHGDPPR